MTAGLTRTLPLSLACRAFIVAGRVFFHQARDHFSVDVQAGRGPVTAVQPVYPTRPSADGKRSAGGGGSPISSDVSLPLPLPPMPAITPFAESAMKSSVFFSSLVAAAILVGSASASAQGLQDLFASPESTPSRSAPAAADSRSAEGDARSYPPRLHDVSGSEPRLRKATSMEIRQARALEAFRQRAARLEAARWAGNPTLRPNWDPMPQTASRYPSHRTLYVPVYLYQ